jgi:hypothetical protein
MNKSRRMRRTGYVARMGEECIHAYGRKSLRDQYEDLYVAGKIILKSIFWIEYGVWAGLVSLRIDTNEYGNEPFLSKK